MTKLQLINNIEKYFNGKRTRSVNDDMFNQISKAVKDFKVSDEIYNSNLEYVKKQIILNRFEAYSKYLADGKVENAQIEIIKAIQELKEIAEY